MRHAGGRTEASRMMKGGLQSASLDTKACYKSETTEHKSARFISG
jgi:hypothetical protein